MSPCPDCQKDLIEVTFDSDRAGKTKCLYCSSCGGSFFEHWDSNILTLNDIKQELSRLFKQEEEVTNINLSPPCPLDQTTMVGVKSEAVPEGLKIFSCPQCHGNWFPRREIVRFKEIQEGKLGQLKKFRVPMGSLGALFLPVFFVAIMTGLTFYARNVVLKNDPYSVQIKAAENYKMLQIKKIDEVSVEISFYTDEPSKSIIYYKTNSDILNKAEAADSRYHYLRIDDLKNPENYLFQIRTTTTSGKEYNSEWLSAK